MFEDDYEDIEDERMCVVESARQHKQGTKEEIELYEQLSLAMELMNSSSFRIERSRICNGIDFNIVTPYPDGLPTKLGSMFFNVSTDYDVRIKETPLHTKGIYRDPSEMNFHVMIKKV